MSRKRQIFLSVKVKPGASRADVQETGPGEYKVSVTAPPIRGRANKEVIQILASHLGISPSRIKILRGQKSRLKRVAVETKA
ncbi:MAG: DUF167 domain-containing protein [Candidatus Aminicenantes bacterium]